MPTSELFHFDVTLTFQWPAWNERDGIKFENIVAASKKDAINRARRMASDAGHTIGRGKYWLRAELREGGVDTQQ